MLHNNLRIGLLVIFTHHKSKTNLRWFWIWAISLVLKIWIFFPGANSSKKSKGVHVLGLVKYCAVVAIFMLKHSLLVLLAFVIGAAFACGPSIASPGAVFFLALLGLPVVGPLAMDVLLFLKAGGFQSQAQYHRARITRDVMSMVDPNALRKRLNEIYKSRQTLTSTQRHTAAAYWALLGRPKRAFDELQLMGADQRGVARGFLALVQGQIGYYQGALQSLGITKSGEWSADGVWLILQCCTNADCPLFRQDVQGDSYMHKDNQLLCLCKGCSKSVSWKLRDESFNMGELEKVFFE
jgi:hypothetical protein